MTYPKECVHFSGCVYACPVPGAITLNIPLPVQLVYEPEPEEEPQFVCACLAVALVKAGAWRNHAIQNI